MTTTNFAFTGTSQTFTVATSGEYDLQAIAGSGGSTQDINSATVAGGNGAEVGAIVNLTAGEQIEVIVGGRGSNSTNQDGGGGGGGTFILANTGVFGTFVPLLVAGGGGGGGFVNLPGVSGSGGAGQASTSGSSAGGAGGGTSGGGGGTGDATIGSNGGGSGGLGGGMFAGGVAGGASNLGTGAFGGGGGGGENGGGGGGGGSGGQGGQGSNLNLPTGGSGASSFFATGDIAVASQTASGANNGNGSAALTNVSPTVTLTSIPTTGPDNSVFTIAGTATYGAGLPFAAGTTVTLSDNGTAVGTTTTATDGTFSAGVTLPFAGANSVVATVVDANGATASGTATYDLFQAVRDLDATSQEVDRLFYTIVNRAADPTTLATDAAKVSKHPGQLNNIANSLIKSKEDHGLYGHQSNSEFVNALFEVGLGRAPDAGSLATDVHHLAHGLSRQALAVSIAESPEAVGHLATRSAAPGPTPPI